MTQTPTLSKMPIQSLAQPVYEITTADKKRQERIADAWKAYNGELDKPLKNLEDGSDPNVMDNICAPAVDTGNAFLFGDEIDITVEKGGPQEAQDLLDIVWGDKEARLPLLQDLGLNGANAGSPFLRIVPGDEEPPAPKTFRLVPVDPSIVVGMETAPQDCDTVLLYCIQYSKMEKLDGRPVEVYYREEIMRVDPDGNAQRGQPDDDDTWQIQHWTQLAQHNMQPKNTGWTPAGAPYAWPYPFPPLFHTKNLPKPNDPWGRPDVTPDLIGINRAINFALSNLNQVGYLYGHPILTGTSVGESRIDLATGKIIILGPDGKIEAVPITSDIANMLAFVEKLYAAAERMTSVPAITMGMTSQMPRGAISGIAIKMLCMALLKKTARKRCLYGDLIIRVCQALFVLAGMSGDIKATLGWQNPIPVDLTDVQAAIQKKLLGVSGTTLQRELGYDPEEEIAYNQEEDERELEKQQAQGVSPAGQPPAQGQPGQPPPQQSPFIGRE